MNNFSPSTDTSVGTKRFTAQEVQLAYTLMAVEYMKTIKGLNPNHQLVDKAVKLKALGFTNSKEVGDAITSEEDLKVLKCYSFLQRHFPGSLILEVTITKKAVDPIVYQPCAYGILIHSMWGEESEDKVFEEYKRINNLML